MIDTQSIRTKILDLAMRGQLTEQLPEDGTAEELYQQIQEEKQTLIKAGKIKKEKPLPEISEGEKPFEIPKSWKWVYLGELFQHNTGKALNASDRQGELLEYITTSNLYWDRFELDDLKQMPFTENEIEKCTVKKGDLLVCEGGDIGRSAIWPFDYDMRIQNHIHRLRRYSSGIYTDFYYYLLWLYKQTGRINGIGIGLQGFSSKRVHSLIVPLAPYEESVRVVEIIKQAFSTLVTIDELQTQYADNVSVLKSKLIDAAIQGKLTEQLPEDGTAEELYQQIRAEKQALIKIGKIKKEKPLPEIEMNEIPFEIPANWKWCRVEDILLSIGSGKSIRCNETAPDDNTPGIIKVSAVTWGSFQENESKTCLSDSDWNEDYSIHSGDFLISRANTRKLVGACVIVDKIRKKLMLSDKILRITFSENIDSQFMLKVMRSSILRNQIEAVATGTSDSMNNISQKEIRGFLIPLPPIAEQKRIVARLDQVLAMIEV